MARTKNKKATPTPSQQARIDARKRRREKAKRAAALDDARWTKVVEEERMAQWRAAEEKQRATIEALLDERAAERARAIGAQIPAPH